MKKIRILTIYPNRNFFDELSHKNLFFLPEEIQKQMNYKCIDLFSCYRDQFNSEVYVMILHSKIELDKIKDFIEQILDSNTKFDLEYTSINNENEERLNKGSIHRFKRITKYNIESL